MTYLERAIKDGHAELKGEGKAEKITYIAVNHTEKYNDPEEKVRAEFWAELIYRYNYDPDCIGVEITVPDRTPSDRADLVIFKDNTRKQPYAVIECKKDGISDSEFNQAVEQAFGNGRWQRLRASYVMVISGGTRRAFDMTDKYEALEREQNIIADIPVRYGKPEEFKYFKNGQLDIKAVSKEELISAIKKCHQSLWEGGRRSPPDAFGELSKIIFVKISDEKNTKRGAPYQFQIKTHEKSSKLAARIKALYETQRQREPNVFTETIKVDDAVLQAVVLHLEGINLNSTDLDTKGVAFEQFMDGFFKGDFGQYFTPREVIAFAVEMTKPTHTELVLDPACGSGGFLLYALDAVRREASDYYDEGTTEHKLHWHNFAQKQLFGIELNDSIARVAKMNMIVHDDGHTNVISVDSLQGIDKIKEENRGFAFNHFDLILTNPPFGATVKKTEKPYLDQYDLDYDWKDGARSGKAKASVKTEILFLERCYQFLKPDGRMAIVLPDGILTNSSLQGVRDWLLEHYRLLAVVSLPQFSFTHYNAGVKASIMFLQKRHIGEQINDKETTFLALTENIGYDATGRKSFALVKRTETDETRIDVMRCDLFDMRFDYKRDPLNPNGWIEIHRQVLSETGLVKEYLSFQKDPNPYFRENRQFTYAVITKNIQGGRQDALYYSPRYEKLLNILAKCKYPKVTINDLCPELVGGATPTRGDAELYAEDGIKFLRILNIRVNEIVLEDVNYIQENVHNGELKRSQLLENDVLMTITGRVGTAAVVTKDILPANINQHIVRLRIQRNDCLPEYLAAYLNTTIGTELSNRGVTGGTRIALDYEVIRKIEIPLPPLEKQIQLIAELNQGRDEVRRLREEAEHKQQATKEKFEKALLG